VDPVPDPLNFFFLLVPGIEPAPGLKTKKKKKIPGGGGGELYEGIGKMTWFCFVLTV
jgi:hypothetical protein